MEEQTASAGKVFLCILNLIVSIIATLYVLEEYSTRQGFIVCNAMVPFLALIGYFPSVLFLGNSVLTRVVRTLIFIWLLLFGYSMYGCVDILAHELGTTGDIPAMRKALLPIPYLSLLLAFICLIRCSPKRFSSSKS